MTARVNIGKVLVGAFLVPWWNRQSFGRALIVPLLSLATLTLTWYFAGGYLPKISAWLFYVGYGALLVVFAVTCHRLVLLDPTSLALNPYPRWTLRDTRFLCWMVGASLVSAVVFVVSSTVIINALAWSSRSPDNQWLGWAMMVSRVPAIYVFARLCLVFPAIALDQPVNLKWAWETTKGNGWRLVVIVAVLPWFLTYIVNMLYREGASTVETIVLTLVGCATFTFEVAALSLAYRELCKGLVEQAS